MASKANLASLRCVLAYHEIQPDPSKYLYRVTNQKFAEHLKFVRGLAQAAPAEQVPEITFDDGHKSNYEQAFPILEEHGVRATFFVVAGRIGTDGELMTWEQACALVKAGHRVQSHGWAHRSLTTCSENDLRLELESSKSEIENRLGVEVDAISAPGGRWNNKVVEACANAGYKQFFHSNPWLPENTQMGIQRQGRHMMTSQMGQQELSNFLHMSRNRVFLQRVKYRVKEQVRVTLGDSLYHKLWIRLAGWSSEDGIEVDVSEPGKGEGDMQHS
jgi:hypothetical protein